MKVNSFSEAGDFKNMQPPSKLFVTGIGTDVGKSYATGWLARELRDAGHNVITQKFIQTGNRDMSEDIIVHRKIMDLPMQTVDKCGLTAPIIFTYPASPDLAARIDNVELNLNITIEAAEVLSHQFSCVIIEGAGGVMVPLRGEYLTIDFIKDQKIPAVVVTNGQLGSINHTLLTLSALKDRGIEIFAVIYNPYFDKDPVICGDTRKYLCGWLSHHSPSTIWMEMPDKI